MADEMLAKFVVDSHFKSQPKGAILDDKSLSESQDDVQPSGDAADPEVYTFFHTHPALLLLLLELFNLNLILCFYVRFFPAFFRYFHNICLRNTSLMRS